MPLFNKKKSEAASHDWRIPQIAVFRGATQPCRSGEVAVGFRR